MVLSKLGGKHAVTALSWDGDEVFYQPFTQSESFIATLERLGGTSFTPLSPSPFPPFTSSPSLPLHLLTLLDLGEVIFLFRQLSHALAYFNFLGLVANLEENLDNVYVC